MKLSYNGKSLLKILLQYMLIGTLLYISLYGKLRILYNHISIIKYNLILLNNSLHNTYHHIVINFYLKFHQLLMIFNSGCFYKYIINYLNLSHVDKLHKNNFYYNFMIIQLVVFIQLNNVFVQYKKIG